VINQAYMNLKRDREAQIGHYFRLLYHILRIVDGSSILTDEEKKDYARILRAHISEPEFALLFYNCIHPDGEKLHPLVEKYDLLQSMSERSVAQPIDLDFYPATKARWEREGKRPQGIGEV
jgi:hypothetical protein